MWDDVRHILLVELYTQRSPCGFGYRHAAVGL
jgi:hypothetical protein